MRPAGWLRGQALRLGRRSGLEGQGPGGGGRPRKAPASLYTFNTILLPMLVREVMTRKAIALRLQDTLREAVAVFAKRGISGAPVVDDSGRVVGIITEMDILRRLEIGTMEVAPGAPAPGGMAGTGRNGPGLKFKTLAEALAGAESLPVSRLMTSPVITARPGDSVQEKAALMVHRRIRRLPVIDGRGRLIGILSRKDLLRMLDSSAAKRRPPARRGARTGGQRRG